MTNSGPKCMVVFSPIFVTDIKMICGYNFITPLRILKMYSMNWGKFKIVDKGFQTLHQKNIDSSY